MSPGYVARHPHRNEETAGFSDHHAALFRHSSEQLEDLTAKNDAAPACPLPELDDFDKRTGPEILIDKTGVADPECIIAVTHDVNKYMFVYTPRVGDSAQRAANDLIADGKPASFACLRIEFKLTNKPGIGTGIELSEEKGIIYLNVWARSFKDNMDLS